MISKKVLFIICLIVALLVGVCIYLIYQTKKDNFNDITLPLPSVSARYVKINAPPGQPINIAGVFIYDQNGNNLITNQNTAMANASMNSIYSYGGVSSNANNALEIIFATDSNGKNNVNRNINDAPLNLGNYSYNGVGLSQNWQGVISNMAHSNGGGNPFDYWQYDFGSDINISAVEIYTRTDCCQERNTNLTVQVISNNGNISQLNTPSAFAPVIISTIVSNQNTSSTASATSTTAGTTSSTVTNNNQTSLSISNPSMLPSNLQSFVTDIGYGLRYQGLANLQGNNNGLNDYIRYCGDDNGILYAALYGDTMQYSTNEKVVDTDGNPYANGSNMPPYSLYNPNNNRTISLNSSYAVGVYNRLNGTNYTFNGGSVNITPQATTTTAGATSTTAGATSTTAGATSTTAGATSTTAGATSTTVGATSTTVSNNTQTSLTISNPIMLPSNLQSFVTDIGYGWRYQGLANLQGNVANLQGNGLNDYIRYCGDDNGTLYTALYGDNTQYSINEKVVDANGNPYSNGSNMPPYSLYNPNNNRTISLNSSYAVNVYNKLNGTNYTYTGGSVTITPQATTSTAAATTTTAGLGATTTTAGLSATTTTAGLSATTTTAGLSATTTTAGLSATTTTAGLGATTTTAGLGATTTTAGLGTSTVSMPSIPQIPIATPGMITNLLNNGIGIDYLTSQGIGMNGAYRGPSTNIVQTNFSGTSNVYSPYLYYNKGSSEKFIGKLYHPYP